MKDYESYNNKGNKDIPDNPRLKKLDVYPRYQESNILPGEYFDCRENALDCAIDDDDNYAYDAPEQGSAETKSQSFDDVKDLTNVVNAPVPATSASIVESAGAAITGTATVVVGAAAAVVAFNATSKAKPTMKVNFLTSGSSYVHYNIVLDHLDKDKDYDIVVKNSQHSFRIDCRDGINDDYVYNLKPGLQYSLTLVSYHELLGDIEYAKEIFYTTNTSEIVGYSDIDIIYNDDLTCGINYKTTLVDDKNRLDNTYVVVRADVDGGEEYWELFNSLYAEEYMAEEPDKYTFNFENKVFSGSIKEVPQGTIYVELYRLIQDDEEQTTEELISSTKKEVIYPLYEDTGSNYISFSGDYDLIKEAKKFNVKKDNLSIKLTLYNEEDVETKFEKEMDITNSSFDYRQLVKQDTVAYSYQVGYYKADKTFVVLKEKEKTEFYGGYYGAYYDPVSSSYQFEKFNIKWNYDADDNEYMDMKILTGFENYGNDDCYYKVDLYQEVYKPTGESTFEIFDTYVGTGDAIFRNVPTYVLDEEDNAMRPAYYKFVYTSLMKYYDEEEGAVEVVMDTFDDNYTNSFVEDITVNSGSLIFRGDGMFEVSLDMDYEQSRPVGEFTDATSTLHFFKDDYNVITDTVTVSGKNVARWLGDYAYLMYDEKFPTEVVGCYVTYEIYYHEAHGNNIRKARTREMINLGDLGYKVEASLERISSTRDYVSGEIELSAYMPEGATLKARVEGGDVVDVPKVNGKYVYSFENIPDGTSIYVDVYASNGDQLTNQAYNFYCMTTDYDYESGYVSYYKNDDANYHTIFTYNNDGTINAYCDTGMFTNVSGLAYEKDYILNVYIDVSDDNVGDNLYTSSVMRLTPENNIAIFKNLPYYGSTTTYTFRYDEVSDFYSDYEGKQTIKTYVGTEFRLFESNYSTMNPYGQLMGYVSYDEDLGQDVITLDIPAGMMYDKDQTIKFESYVTADDDPIIVEGKLSDYLRSSTDDGDYYVFNIDSSAIVGGTINLYMMYNYTLTEENYNRIKDIYSGNLYNSYTVTVTHV